MDIASEVHGQVLLLRPEGRLDTETAGELELALHDAFESGRRHFILDMVKVSYVSSAGLRVLLALAKKIDGDIGTLRLAALNASVKQVFDIAGFTALFDIRANQKAALDKHPHAIDTQATSRQIGDLAANLLGAQATTSTTGVQAPTAAMAARLLGVPAASSLPKQAEVPNRATVVGGPADPRLETPAKSEGSKDKSAGVEPKPGLIARLFKK